MENDSYSCPACDLSINAESIYCIECGTNILLAQKTNLSGIITEVVIDDDLIANYSKLKQSLVEMSNAEDIADGQKIHLEDLNWQLFRLNDLISNAKEQARNENKDVNQLKNLTWTSLKAIIKRNRGKKLSKEEYEFQEALNEYLMLIEQKHGLKKQIKVAESQWNEAKKLVDTRNTLVNEIKRVIKEVGENVSYPIKDKLKEDERILSKRLHAVEHQLFVLKSNHSTVKSAIELYHSASKALEGTGLLMADFWMGDSSLHTLESYQTKRQLQRKAGYLTQQAAGLLGRAILTLKGESTRIPAHLKNTDFQMDTFLDGIWGDIHPSDGNPNSYQSVNLAIQGGKLVYSKYQELISTLSDELAYVRVEYDRAASKLEEERIKMLEMYMEKRKSMD